MLLLPGYVGSFSAAFMWALLVIVTGRAGLATAIRWLNRSVWSDDLCPVPPRRVTGLLITGETLLPFLLFGTIDGVAAIQISLGWAQPGIVLPAAGLAGLLVTVPAYALFLSCLMRTTVLRALAVQASSMAVMLAMLVALWGSGLLYIGARKVVASFLGFGSS